MHEELRTRIAEYDNQGDRTEDHAGSDEAQGENWICQKSVKEIRKAKQGEGGCYGWI